MSDFIVSDVRLTAAGYHDRRRGLLGYVSLLINGTLRLDGLALRRTTDGNLTLSFPARRDRNGTDHPYIRPIDAAVRSRIERQVLAALQLDGAIVR